MVISPLLIPVVCISSGFYKKDWKNILKGFYSLIGGLLIIIIAYYLISIFSKINYDSEIISRISANLIDYFFIAFFFWTCWNFCFFWPDISESVVGIAISVALVPPVVLVGVGLSQNDIILVLFNSKIVIINIFGIFLGAFIMFSFLNKKTTNKL